MREGFPLQWPDDIERTKSPKRAMFKAPSIDAPRKGILKQIKLLRGTNAVITTNIPLKKDGQLYATGQPAQGEMAVAVYFTWLSKEYVVACDNYDRIQDNLRVAEKIIEAIRGIERWGNQRAVQQAFKGFGVKELPPASKIVTGRHVTKGPVYFEKNWWEVLGVAQNTTAEVLRAAYRALAKQYHPDNKETGDKKIFADVMAAYEQGSKEVK